MEPFHGNSSFPFHTIFLSLHDLPVFTRSPCLYTIFLSLHDPPVFTRSSRIPDLVSERRPPISPIRKPASVPQILFFFEKCLFQLCIFLICTHLPALRLKGSCHVKAFFHVIAWVLCTLTACPDSSFFTAADHPVSAPVFRPAATACYLFI